MDSLKSVIIQKGADGIKQAYEQSLKAGKIDIICLADSYENIIGDYFEQKYAPRLFGQTITREILPDSPENRVSTAKKDQKKNKVRFIKNNFPSQSDILLFSGQAVLISYNPENPYALLIKDAELVSALQNQFEALWKFLG